MKSINFFSDLRNNSIPIDMIASKTPGMLHINRVSDLKPIYIDPKSAAQLGITQQKNKQAAINLVHPDDLEPSIKSVRFYLENIDDYKTISFIQRILNLNTQEYTAYYTTSMLIESRGGLVSFSVPIHDIDLQNKSVDKVLEETLFIKKNTKRIAKLSNRELELVKFLAQKTSNEDIAMKMQLSLHTIKSYKKRIYKKLEINTFSQLYEYIKAFDLS